MRRFFCNLSLVVGSLCLLGVILETVVFRYILVAADFPRVVTVDGVIRYVPGQTGTTRVKNEITARYAINAAGWNSGHVRYQEDRQEGKRRVAIIGDSYVEGFSVDYDNSLAEQLERMLGPDRFEVYRFGIGGAPLSQYLNMLRREVLSYRPDWVVVVVAHNDFDESYLPAGGVYEGYFMKLEMKNHRVTGEVPPQPYRARWFTPIRYSATWRYLHVRQRLGFGFLKRIILGDGEHTFRANIDVSQLSKKMTDNTAATEYLFHAFKSICDEAGMKLLIVMDGDRGQIYENPDGWPDDDSEPLRLNRMAQQTATELGIAFIDLHPIFARRFSESGRRFNFRQDAHWNALGHGIVAEVIREFIQQERSDTGMAPQHRRSATVAMQAKGGITQ